MSTIMIIKTIDLLFQMYMLMLFARILSSWVPEFQGSRVVQFIAFYTDPYLNVFRRIIPPLGMMDLSPIVAFLALQFFKDILLSFLR